MALFACSSYEFARHFVRFSNPSKLVMNLAGAFIDSVRKGNYARFGGRRRAFAIPEDQFQSSMFTGYRRTENVSVDISTTQYNCYRVLRFHYNFTTKKRGQRHAASRLQDEF